MGVGAAFLQYVLEQVERTGRVTSRRMFGAVGLYSDGIFFGIIDDDTLYMRVDDTTRPEYEARGCKPFRPYPDRPEVSMTYYAVPADILDDAEQLVRWARQAVSAAVSKKASHRAAKKAPARKKMRRKSREKSS